MGILRETKGTFYIKEFAHGVVAIDLISEDSSIIRSIMDKRLETFIIVHENKDLTIYQYVGSQRLAHLKAPH